MDDENDTTIEEQLEQLEGETRVGERTDGPTASMDDRDPVAELVACITAVREGEATQSFGARDNQIAAYLAYLSAHPETMRAVGEEATDQLTRSPSVNHEQKSGIVRLLFRLGLQEAMPEHDEQLGDAIATYARENL